MGGRKVGPGVVAATDPRGGSRTVVGERRVGRGNGGYHWPTGRTGSRTVIGGRRTGPGVVVATGPRTGRGQGLSWKGGGPVRE